MTTNPTRYETSPRLNKVTFMPDSVTLSLATFSSLNLIFCSRRFAKNVQPKPKIERCSRDIWAIGHAKLVRTSLVIKEFIVWKRDTIFLRETEFSPKRVRAGSQSQCRILLIVHANGASHISRVVLEETES